MTVFDPATQTLKAAASDSMRSSMNLLAMVALLEAISEHLGISVDVSTPCRVYNRNGVPTLANTVIDGKRYSVDLRLYADRFVASPVRVSTVKKQAA